MGAVWTDTSSKRFSMMLLQKHLNASSGTRCDMRNTLMAMHMVSCPPFNFDFRCASMLPRCIPFFHRFSSFREGRIIRYETPGNVRYVVVLSLVRDNAGYQSNMESAGGLPSKHLLDTLVLHDEEEWAPQLSDLLSQPVFTRLNKVLIHLVDGLCGCQIETAKFSSTRRPPTMHATITGQPLVQPLAFLFYFPDHRISPTLHRSC